MINQIFQNLNFRSETQLFVSKLLIQIFFPPLMIFFWGKEKFDVWLFLFSIPAFISIFQFSIISPVRNHMFTLFKKKKFDELNLYYQNSFLFLLLNILIITIFSVIFITLNIKNVVLTNNLEILFLVYLTFFINILTSNSYTALTYRGSLARIYKIEIFFNIIMNLCIPFSYFFISFDHVFYLVLFIALCQHFKQYSIINDKYLYRYIKIKFFSFEILKKIIKISYGFNFQIIADIIKGPGFISVLGLTNNISFIGMISTLRTMFYFLPMRLLAILEKTFFLEYLKMINKKNKKKFFLYYIKINILILILLIFFLCLSFLLGGYFYAKWTNYNYNFDNELIFLIALDASLYILASFLALPLKSINNYGIIGLFNLLINTIIVAILYHYNFFNDLIFSFKIVLIGSFLYLILSIYLSNIYISKINGVSKQIKR